METAIERSRKVWQGKSDEWIFERLTNELKQKVEEIHRLLAEKQNLINEIRTSFADYIVSEGCSCCQDREPHQEAAKRLGELLNVEKHSDDSGYNFYLYRSDKK